VSILPQDNSDVYLRFWEHYHYNLTLTGLSANKNWTVIPCAREAMEEAAKNCYLKLGYEGQPDSFKYSINAAGILSGRRNPNKPYAASVPSGIPSDYAAPSMQ
jgi:hypothetical protein